MIYPRTALGRLRFAVVLLSTQLTFQPFSGPHATAAPVLPTDNTAPPYMGLYGGSLSDSTSAGTGISRISATKNWLYRTSMYAQTFLPSTSWATHYAKGFQYL